MKRSISLSMVLLLALLLSGCGLAGQDDPRTFDQLARLVPSDAESPFFLNHKPLDEPGRLWQQFRARVEAVPAGQDALDGMLTQFHVEEYRLAGLIAGPAVSGYWHGTNYAILQIEDKKAIHDAMMAIEPDLNWQEKAVGDQVLYQVRLGLDHPIPYLAWTIRDDLLVIATRYQSSAMSQLEDLLNLEEEDSLAALPAWKTLRSRLPDDPLGLTFIAVAAQSAPLPAASSADQPGDILARNLQAVALALIPEEGGLRVEIDGLFVPDAGAVPELRRLFDLPAVDPGGWPALPAGTALAVISHDASTIWPWIKSLLNADVTGSDALRDAIGLDLEHDLLGPDGPLTGAFTLAVSPPLPDQPISAGFPAVQVLFVAPEAGRDDVARLRAALESQGATVGPVELDGVQMERQLGTGPSGYALAYTLEEGTLYLGSAPQVVANGVAAGRKQEQTGDDAAYRRVLMAMPANPFIFVYLAGEPLFDLVEANRADDTAATAGEVELLRVFEAIGVGLQLDGERLEGAVYFALPEQ